MGIAIIGLRVGVFMEAISKNWTDRMGTVASSVCAVHCAICGFLPVAFSTLGLGFLLGHGVEWVFSGTAIFLGLVASVLAVRQRRSPLIVGMLAAGIVLLIVSRGLETGMGHDGHHEASHHEASHHEDSAHETFAEHHAHGHSNEGHGGEHGADSMGEVAHLAGATIGVFAGLFLFLGHIFNLRAAHRCREECCDLEEDGLRPLPFHGK